MESLALICLCHSAVHGVLSYIIWQGTASHVPPFSFGQQSSVALCYNPKRVARSLLENLEVISISQSWTKQIQIWVVLLLQNANLLQNDGSSYFWISLTLFGLTWYLGRERRKWWFYFDRSHLWEWHWSTVYILCFYIIL